MPRQIGFSTLQPQSKYYDKKSRYVFSSTAIPFDQASNEGEEESRINQIHMNHQGLPERVPVTLSLQKFIEGGMRAEVGRGGKALKICFLVPDPAICRAAT